MKHYVALLRGINVGGKNLIKMTTLRACFEEHGFENVATYIQSGNVVFTSEKSGQSDLTHRIERVLGETFAYQATVVLRSLEQMRGVVSRAPKGFGKQPARHRYDVIFLKEPLTAATAIKSVDPKEGVDAVFKGTGVLYFSRLTSKAVQSRLSRVVSLPIYKSMTIRNWNTTTKLLDLLEDLGS